MATSSSVDRREASVNLEIGFDRQNDLVQELVGLCRELEESPTVIPDRDKESLRGINIRPPSDRLPGAFLSIESNETQGKQPQAAIVITDRSKNVGGSAIAYHFRPIFDQWEEWLPSQSAPVAIHDSTTMVGLLEDKFSSDILEGLQDHAPSGIEIVHMLISHLRRKARTRLRDTRYLSSRIILGGEDIILPVDSELTIKQNGSRIIRALAVTASNLTDMGVVEKTYSYRTEHSGPVLNRARGSVTVSTVDDIPKTRLEGFARRDQERNHPVEAIDRAMYQLREEYELPI